MGENRHKLRRVNIRRQSQVRLERSQPRNPLVVPARARKAGRHLDRRDTSRQQARADIVRALKATD